MNRNIFNRSGFSLVGFCRNKPLRKVLATWCAFATLVTTCGPAFAALDTTYANTYTGFGTVNGTVGITGVDDSVANTITITHGGSAGVVQWNDFGVGAGKTATFNGAGTIYNDVVGNVSETTIDGIINGSANVWVINPMGVVFGANSVVDVGGLFAAAAGALSTSSTASDYAALTGGGLPAFSSLDAAVTVNPGAKFGDANSPEVLFAGKTIDIQSDSSAPATTTAFKGPTTIIAGNAVTIDSIGGGTVTLSGLAGNSANTVNLMGDFAKNLAVKAKDATVKVTGDLSVGTDGVGGDFTVDGADLTLAKNANLTVEGGLTAGEVIQSHTGTAKSTVTVKGDITGNVSQESNSKNTTLTAAKITGDVIQDGKGTITTGYIGGDFQQDGGTLQAAADAIDPTKTAVEFNGEVAQGGDSAIIKADTMKFNDANKVVDVQSANNEIGKITGAAKSVDLVTKTDLAVDALDTSAAGGAVTLDAGTKKITFTGNNTVGTGTLTLKSAAEQTDAGTITATVIDNSAEGATLTQSGGGTITSSGDLEIKGDVVQSDGTIQAATLTLDGAATQTEGAKVVATTAVALNAAGKDIVLGSTVNDIAKVTGTAGSVDVATTKAIELNALTTTGDTKVFANDGTADKDITLVGVNSAAKYDLTGAAISQAAGSTIAADEVALTASGAVALNDTTGNAIQKVGGTASAVTLVTTTDLEVGDLGTANGDVTLDAGAKEIEFTGAAATGTGIITLNSTAKQTSGSITAAEIKNAALFTQDGGTITTPSVTGAFTQNGGTLTSSGDLTVGGAVTQNGGTIEVGDPVGETPVYKTITFSDAVEQKYVTPGAPAVIGKAEHKNNVVFNGTFKQEAKTPADGANAAPVLNAHNVEFNQDVDDGDVNGTINVETISGSGTVVLNPDEIGENFTLSGTTTLKAKEVGDNFTQTGGTLLAKDTDAGIEFLGSFTQSGGTVGDSTPANWFDVIVDGLLTQSGGTIFAKMLTLNGVTPSPTAATQSGTASIQANTLALGNAAKAFALDSKYNKIGEVGGTAASLDLRTDELTADNGLVVKNLTTTDDTKLTVKKASDDSVLKLTFDGANSIATDDGKKLTVDAGVVGQKGGSSLKTTELHLPATVVTLTENGNEIKKISGTADAVTLKSKVAVTIEDLNKTGSGSGIMTITAADETDVDPTKWTKENITFAGSSSAVKFDLTGKNIGETDVAGTAVTADELAINAAGNVKLDEANAANAIGKISGSAAQVDLKTTGAANLSVDGLSTATANGNITLDAGDKEVKFTSANSAGTGTVILKSAAEVVSGSVTAGKIDNGTAAKLLTQTAGTITTPEVTGDFTQNGGLLTSAADVKIGGTLDQDGGTITAQKLTLLKDSTVAAAVNATSIDATGKTLTQDGAGTVNVTGADGIKAATVAQTVTGGSIYTKKVTGNVSQTGTGGTLHGNGSAIEITGTVDQNADAVANAVIGQAAQDVTIGGKLTQTMGTLNGKTIALNGGAEQSTPANGQIVNATTLALGDASKDVTLASEQNTIGTVQGAGKAITVVDKAGGLVVGALTANDALSLTTRSGNITQTGVITAKDTATFAAVDASDSTVRGNVVLDQNNDFANAKKVSATGANITLVDKDSILLGDVDASGTLTVTAKEGDIKQTALPDKVKAAGIATFKAVGGDIVLDNVNNDFGDVVNLDASKKVVIKEANSLKLGRVRAGTDFEVAITDGNLNQKMPADLDYTADDYIKVDGDTKITVGGSYDTMTDTWTGDVNLKNPNNRFAGKLDVEGYDVSLYSAGNMKLNTITAKGALDVSAESITAETTAKIKSGTAMYTAHVPATDSDAAHGAMTLTARNGSITTPATAAIEAKAGKFTADASIAGGVALAGTVEARSADLKANDGQGVNVSNVGNDFGNGLVDATGASVTLKDKNSITLGNVSAKAGAVDVTALDGDLTVASEKTVQASQNIQLTATDADKTDSTVKGNIAIATQGKVKSGSTGNITLTADGGVTSAAASAPLTASELESGALLTVTARGGDIALGGLVKAGGAATFTAQDAPTATEYFDITLGNPGSSFAAQLNAYGNDITLAAGAGGIKLGEIYAHDQIAPGTDKGDLTVTTANGNISQYNGGGGVTVEGVTTLDAGTKDITLTDANNDFVGAVTAEGGTITLLDKNSILLDQIDAGVDLSVTAKNGDIEELTTGEIAVKGAATFKAESSVAGKGRITLEGANRMSGDVNADAVNGITVRNDAKLTVGNVKSDKGDIVLYTTDTTPVFDDTKAYAVDNEVIYDNVHYKATAAHAANDGWISGNWTPVVGNPQSDIVLANAKTVEATQGNVTLRAFNDLLIGTDTQDGTIKAKGDITLRGGYDSTASTPGYRTDGNYGSVALNEDAKLVFHNSANGNLVIGANKDVTIEKPADDSAIALPNGKIAITTENGDITIHRQLSTAKLDAADTSITVDAGEDLLIDNDVTAADSKIVLAAGQNIDVQQNGASKNPILSAKTTISATADTGYIKIGKDSTASDATKLVAEKDISLTATAGSVTVQDAAKVLAGKSTTDGNVKIYAAKDQTTGAGDAVVQDTAEVTASKAVEIIAKDDVKVTDKALVWAKGTGVTAGDTLKIDAQNGSIEVNGSNAGYARVVAGDFTLTPGVLPTPAPTDTSKLNFHAGTAISVKNQAAVAAAGDFTATADNGDVTVQKDAYALTGGNMLLTAADAPNTANPAVAPVTGSIVVDDDAHVFVAGTLTATAVKDVTVQQASTVQAGGLTKVTATTGDITVGKTGTAADVNDVRTDDALELKAGKNIVIQDAALVKAAKSVTATAGNDMKVLDQAKVWAQGGAANAAGNVVDFAATAGAIDVNGNGAGYAQVVAGDFTLTPGVLPTPASTDTSKMKLAAGTSVSVQKQAAVAAAGDFTATAGNGAITVEDQAAALAGGNMILTASGATVGDIMVDQNANVMAAGTLTATAADSVTVEQSSNVKVGGLTKIEATAGDITVGKASTAADKNEVRTDDAMELKAGKNIVIQDAALVKAAKSITATADTVDIKVLDTAKVWAQGGAANTAGNVVDFTATAGNVEVNGNGSTAGFAQVIAGDFTLTPGVLPTPASTDTSKLNIKAGTAISVKDNAAVAAAGDFTAVADNGDVTVQGSDSTTPPKYAYALAGGNMVLTAADAPNTANPAVAPVTGSIVVDGNANVLVAGTLTATAAKDVTVQNTAAVKAGGLTKVTATAGDITVGKTGTATDANEVRTDDALELVAGNDVVIQDKALVKAAKSVTATAGNDMKVLDQAKVWAQGGAANAAGNVVDITAASAIDVNGNGAGYAQVIAGDFSMTPGTLPTPASTDTSKMNLSAGTSISVQKQAAVAAAGDFTAVAGNGAITVEDQAAALAGGNMSLTAVGATVGDIMIDQNANVMAAGTLTATAADSVTVEQSSNVKAGGLAKITATAGDITVGKAATAADVNDVRTDDALELKAGKNIIVQDKAVVKAAKSVKATADANDIKVLDQAKVWAQGTGVAATDNTVDFKATAGNIEVNGNSAGYAQVVAGDFTLTPGTLPTPASTDTSKMNLKAGKAISVKNQAAVAAAGDLTAAADDGDVTVQNQAYMLAGGNMIVTAADAAAPVNTGSILVDNNATVMAAGTLTATAAKDVTVQTASNVKSTGAATITAQNGDVKFGDGTTADNVQVSSDAKVKVEATNGEVLIQDNAVVSAGTTAAGADVEIVADDIVVKDNATVTAKSAVSLTADKNDGAISPATAFAIKISGSADIVAGTTVDIKSTDTTAPSDITIDTTGTIVANDGDVKVENADGKVTIQNATVTAKKGASATSANVDIDAKGDVTIDSAANVVADNKVTIDTTVGSTVGHVKVDAATVTAKGGDVLVGTTTAKVATFTADNGATVEATGANGSVKVYTAGAITVQSTTGATKIEAKDAGTTPGTGDVVFDAGANVTVDNAAVTADNAIDIDSIGTVLVDNGATVTANGSAATPGTATLTIDAVAPGAGDVKFDNGASITVAKGDMTINADNDIFTGGTPTTAGATISVAGDLTATADADNSGAGAIDLNGQVTVNGNTTLSAAGKVEADNTANDFGATAGTVSVANGTSVTLVDANAIDVAGVNASGKVDVDATDITVSGAVATIGTDATGGDVDLDASTGNIAVNATVTAANDANVRANGAAGNVTTTAAITAANDATVTAGNDVSLGANVDATAGNATVTATAGDIASTSGAVVGAGNTVIATAGDSADVNLDAANVNVTAGGNADVDVVAGAHNPTGDLAINSNTPGVGNTSVNAGGDLNLDVAGDISTVGGKINAGGNFDLEANTASTPLDINVGGSKINANLSGQSAIAFNDSGKTYDVNGNGSHTAVLIDGRVAGGDPRYFSVLNSYEAEVGRGVVSGPLAVPFVFNIFTSPFFTMDMPIAAPGNLGQTYMNDEAGSIDAGDAFPEADTTLTVPGLPANSTIFFGTSDEGTKNKTAAL